MPEPAEGTAKGEKQNIVVKLWRKLGLEPFQILLAVKGALPATIALAAYESLGFAEIYTTLGYLVAIMAHLSMAIQPRAKFIQSLLTNVFFVCCGAAMALLELQCVIAARASPAATTMVGGSGSRETDTYDAAANAVAAVWLCVWVYIANLIKYSRPQMMISVIQFSIFVIVASVYGPSFTTMAQALSFVRRLLISFLTGHAIATGVSLFILPVTSRSIATKQMAGLLNVIRGCVASHAYYMDSISPANKEHDERAEEAAAAKVRELTTTAGELMGKIKLELSFARKEIAFGKLTPKHFSDIFNAIRAINQPVMGMASFLEIIKTLNERKTNLAAIPDMQDTMDAIKKLERDEWDAVITISKEAHNVYQNLVFSGIDHILYQLELAKRPKAKKEDAKIDVEKSAGDSPQPGEAGFAEHLGDGLRKYAALRNQVIKEWADRKHISLADHFMPSNGEGATGLKRLETALLRNKLNRHQLYLILYVNFLSSSVGRSVLSLVRYADSLVEDGTMSRKRFINPGWRRLRKLMQDAFTHSSSDETLAAEVNGGSNVFLGDALNQRRDPEHLAPTNAYEKATELLRKVPALFQSEASSFAFRVVFATMSIGIVCFIRETRNFFLTQRGLWALIMAAISMDPHAGQGIFGFLARTFGTFVAAAASIVIWYMCDRNRPAILVIFLIYMTGWLLFLLKNPRYAVVAIISSVTVILIVGYELQVDVIGQTVAASNGQPVYSIYILAPYRLATVVIGLGVAFIWTVFPYPITTRGALRKDIGSTLYILANFYSCVHTTLDARLKLGPAINDLGPEHPIKKLDVARTKTFGKVLLMLTQLRAHSDFTKFEPTFGGRFPSETYAELVTAIRNLFLHLSLILYSSKAYIENDVFESAEDHEEIERWMSDFRTFTSQAKMTSHQITTNLCLLSSAIRYAQPLPPYLQAPRALGWSDKMEAVDPSILNVKQFGHPCYAAFAVGEVASSFVSGELAKVTRLIKTLVGEVDFSFHIMSTADDHSETSTLWEKDAPAANGASGKNVKED